MTTLQKMSARGLHVAHHRHAVLLKVVRAASAEELNEAHAQVAKELSEKNIWVAMAPDGPLLTRDWPEAPGWAIVSFPDQGTALQVIEEIGANSGSNPYSCTGTMSYADAIKTADANSALLVMVTYDGEIPHYVPIAHFDVKASGS